MAIAEEQQQQQKSPSDGKVWNFFKLPFRHSNTTPSSSSSSSSQNAPPPHANNNYSAHHSTVSNSNNSNIINMNNISNNNHHLQVEGSNPHGSNSVSSVARSLLPARRRLKLDPSNKLYFPCKSFFFLVFDNLISIYFGFGDFCLTKKKKKKLVNIDHKN